MAENQYVEEIQDTEGNVYTVRDKTTQQMFQHWLDTYANGSGGDDTVVFMIYGVSVDVADTSVPAVINGVEYTESTYFSYGSNVHGVFALVPKNKPFTYTIGGNGNSWSNGTGTLTLSENYALQGITKGVPEKT